MPQASLADETGTTLTVGSPGHFYLDMVRVQCVSLPYVGSSKPWQEQVMEVAPRTKWDGEFEEAGWFFKRPQPPASGAIKLLLAYPSVSNSKGALHWGYINNLYPASPYHLLEAARRIGDFNQFFCMGFTNKGHGILAMQKTTNAASAPMFGLWYKQDEACAARMMDCGRHLLGMTRYLFVAEEWAPLD